MRVTKFIHKLLSLERPEEPDGEDHRAVKIKGLPNHVVVGIKEYSNAIQIIVKEKEKHDRR